MGSLLGPRTRRSRPSSASSPCHCSKSALHEPEQFADLVSGPNRRKSRGPVRGVPTERCKTSPRIRQGVRCNLAVPHDRCDGQRTKIRNTRMNNNKVIALVLGAIAALWLLLRFVLLSQTGVPGFFYFGLPI